MKERVPMPSLAKQILRPFQEFMQKSASGGVLLLLCTVAAVGWANSPWASSYTDLWQTRISFGFGSFILAKPLLLWVNDGLMAIFFFVVGLEIKREVLIGELSSVRQAALPIAAALGGMIVPAGIYFIMNRGTATEGGWGIPMATDIAFALGILTLLGDRVPLALKVFLTALAIVDDIGAVLVIALFYTAEISWMSLTIGGVILVLLMAANLFGIRHWLVYALLGAGLWLAFLKSGVHVTVAGVLVAMTIPARAGIDAGEFLDNSRAALVEFERGGTKRNRRADERSAASGGTGPRRWLRGCRDTPSAFGARSALGRQLRKVAERLFRLWGQYGEGNLDQNVWESAVNGMRLRIQGLLERGAGIKTREHERSERSLTKNTCKEMLEVEPAMWLFVKKPGVGLTNNEAERALRHAVLWRRVSFGSQSQSGAEMVGRMLTVVMTLKRRGESVHKYLVEACRARHEGRAAPTLLPAATAQLAKAVT